MLKENTLFGVRDKVAEAIQRLRSFEPEEGYYVAFSGGKAILIKGDICWVKCDRCGVETAAETSTTEAIAAWNRRANDEQTDC